MKKTQKRISWEIETKVLAVGLLLITSASAADAQFAFRPPENIRNLPLWVDKNYNPEVLNGAMHIRIGMSGVHKNSVIGRDNRLLGSSQGESNCDLNYLFHAKANTEPSPQEISTCAFQEEKIRQARDGKPRDMNDSFVRADVEKEWAEWMRNRIAMMRQHNKFYFRHNISLRSYDMAKGAFEVDILLMPSNHFYRPSLFEGFGIDQVGQWFRTSMSPDVSLARDLEWARSKGLIDSATNVIQFDLDGVSEENRRSSIHRVYKISNIRWEMAFFRPSGVRSVIAIGN